MTRFDCFLVACGRPSSVTLLFQQPTATKCRCRNCVRMTGINSPPVSDYRTLNITLFHQQPSEIDCRLACLITIRGADDPPVGDLRPFEITFLFQQIAEVETCEHGTFGE